MSSVYLSNLRRKKDFINEYLKEIKSYDEITFRHSEGVANLSKEIAISLELSNEEVESIYFGSLLHDIGKLKISKDILSSTEKLTDKEFEEIKEHPSLGLDFIIKGSEVDSDEIIKDIIINHHERLDGSGYPNKKIARDISIYSRIVGVTDSYDAMTEKRTYNIPKSKKAAIKELRSKKYDQEIVDILEVLVSSDN